MPTRFGPSRARQVAIGVVIIGISCIASACSSSSASSTPNGKIIAVGAENQYANVISQIGGKYVSTTAILSNPNTDPHTFESSPQVANVVSAAELVVQNGVGYDPFMNKIEAASPSTKRKVIDVQALLRLPDSTSNPHLWYKPTTMPAVARAIGQDLSALTPAHAAYFTANVARFTASLQPWYQAIAAVKSQFPGAPVATTEPVGDYMLEAAGTQNLTPFTFQADIMNGVDPSPQDVSIQTGLFTKHKVKVFVYNQQVTDSLTESLLKLAHQNDIPVVGVYETMPAPGYDYQSWMVAEVHALDNALAHGTSSPKL
jgi:zinc/manganese transport system substrate-binding protein